MYRVGTHLVLPGSRACANRAIPCVVGVSRESSCLNVYLTPQKQTDIDSWCFQNRRDADHYLRACAQVLLRPVAEGRGPADVRDHTCAYDGRRAPPPFTCCSPPIGNTGRTRYGVITLPHGMECIRMNAPRARPEVPLLPVSKELDEDQTNRSPSSSLLPTIRISRFLIMGLLIISFILQGPKIVAYGTVYQASVHTSVARLLVYTDYTSATAGVHSENK